MFVSKVSNLDKNLKAIHDSFGVGESIQLKIELDKPLNYGYLVYCGFKLRDIIDDESEVVVSMVKHKHIEMLSNKKYSFFIKLARTGRGGKRILVYKLRTMQPYAEYLQDFVIAQNGLNDDGTIKNDFRITKFGKIARKYWLDELPMLFNFIKGDLKFIGVRPLSDSMLSQYPQAHLEIRHKSKPGLIPPYYIDKPKTFDEIIVSEKRYLDKYKKSPILTDISYFGKFLKVVFKGVRSS